ncbi:unnamed protein product [Arctia plantaginis]|uniref:MADF domain-containing protein n=1 Tax=Arctia plantaginis TaxID=874455 RepID=A0A8S1ASQ0_ARCPL|nr:unnamed protein product [Arctia plantaginis]CAB3249683.1 unnamed protein product [Arctia plantaginis]
MQEEEEDTSSSDTNACLTSEAQSYEVEFVKTYERLPILWDVNHPDYTNKYRRAVANDALLEIMKKWDKSATRLTVRQKINILRSSYRKDLRKHLKSKTIGQNGEQIYEYNPRNWKFYALRFLGGKVDDEEIESNKDQNSIVEIKLNSSYFDAVTNEEAENDAIKLQTSNVQQTFNDDEAGEKTQANNKKNKKKRMKSAVEDYYVDDNVLEKEFEAISSNVVCKLRRMNPEQRCHAELLINKVLIGGLKNSLTDETDLTEVYK